MRIKESVGDISIKGNVATEEIRNYCKFMEGEFIPNAQKIEQNINQSIKVIEHFLNAYQSISQ